jgi:hypothetical protein
MAVGHFTQLVNQKRSRWQVARIDKIKRGLVARSRANDTNTCFTARDARRVQPINNFLLLVSNMSELLRRSTMQPATDVYGNTRSGLPMPSTVKKASSSAMRMSLAGPAARTPYLPPGAGSGSNIGHSGYRSQNVNPLLQSTSKPNYGRTPLTK